eukprot:Gb_27280 [translate_table: standard]
MGIKSPIIGLTGNALDSDRNQFLAAGVDDFFTKPISRHQLVRLLEAHHLQCERSCTHYIPAIPGSLESVYHVEDGGFVIVDIFKGSLVASAMSFSRTCWAWCHVLGGQCSYLFTDVPFVFSQCNIL